MKSNTDFRERLYTIDARGNRLWVYCHVVWGVFRRYRAAVAAVLLCVYLGLPWITIGGSQAVHLNIIDREFTIFGNTFFASDTEFLVLVLGGLAFSLFFFTAILGRIWCGWACPETIFLEFVFRPIERFCEGPVRNQRDLNGQPWTREKVIRKGLKWFLFLIVTWILATTTVAYFVGSGPMFDIVRGSPANHPGLFALTVVVMGLLLFQFGWFREQFCTVLCPYARFQSVLMDERSLLVGYDVRRGEPRGKHERGDCIDCGLCVRVCPTGIDIRNGLQLECVQCTACADACDSIMKSLDRAPGLVRYTTQERLAGSPHGVLRPRVIVYAVILCVYAIIFGVMLWHRPTAEFRILRKPGASPYQTLADGKISNHIDLHITNKSNQSADFWVDSISDPRVHALTPIPKLTLTGRALGDLPVFLTFSSTDAPDEIAVTVNGSDGFTDTRSVQLIKPDRGTHE